MKLLIRFQAVDGGYDNATCVPNEVCGDSLNPDSTGITHTGYGSQVLYVDEICTGTNCATVNRYGKLVCTASASSTEGVAGVYWYPITANGVAKVLIEFYSSGSGNLAQLRSTATDGSVRFAIYSGSAWRLGTIFALPAVTGDAANLQYGKLGGLVAKALGYKPTRAATWSLAQWDGFPDENGHGEWVLRHEVATALEELGWVRPDRIGEKAEAARRQILEKDPELAAESPTTRKALIDARSGQGRFRESVVRYWGGCAVTGCVDADLLVASHIVPWAGATNQERLDPFNGLLLIPALDVLFDRHLISFTDKGAMLISAMLKNDTRRIFGLTAKLKLRRLDDRHLPYLARHRERFFELQK